MRIWSETDLADAGATEDAEGLAGRNGEADILEDGERAEGLGDMLEGDVGGGF